MTHAVAACDSIVRRACGWGGYSARDLDEGCAFLEAVPQGCLVPPAVLPAVAQALRCCAFRLAIWNDHAHTVQALLDLCGAHWITASRPHELLPLYEAAAYGATATVHVLLAAKAGLECQCQWKTPLGIAARNGHADTVAVLLEAKAKLNGLAVDGPLKLAAQEGDVQVVAVLLKAKAQVNRWDGAGELALCRATIAGHADTVDMLVHEGAADVDLANCSGLTPLRYAARNGHTRIVSIILGAKANVNVTDIDGWTPLQVAVESSHAPANVAVLVQAKADVHAPNCRGCTALSICRRRQVPGMLELLVNGQPTAEARAPEEAQAPGAGRP